MQVGVRTVIVLGILEASMRIFTAGAFIFSTHSSQCSYSDSFFSDNGEVWRRATVNVIL
ncbi:hypothetical protein M405DRAFT_795876 [Rhizopogon salebrosus TDB-379]|nr:hypothetical protein M405DRAFT_795876 [Rhizopogon salebrosus TDB-379]